MVPQMCTHIGRVWGDTNAGWGVSGTAWQPLKELLRQERHEGAEKEKAVF